MTPQQLDASGPATRRLPSALAAVTDLAHRLQRQRPVLFLDYDGTLTPIVARPHLAVLSQSVRSTLAALADRWPVAIVSGRDRADVQRLVGIDKLIYAGSHGFDIRGPDLSSERGAAFVADLDSVEQALRRALAGIDGVLLERKKYALAVHVRGLAADAADAVESVVDAAAQPPQPACARVRARWCSSYCPVWIGTRARPFFTFWICSSMASADAWPIYIGDDRTDEDAFMVLAGRGVGILVAETPRETAAYYTLRNPDEVHHFLRRLLGAGAAASHPL